jgi:putative addiction module component (TIGR02574 family)
MTLASFPQLKRLPARKRLQLAEALWDSAVSDDLPVPTSHKKLLRERRAAYERGEMRIITMDELRASLRRRP